MSGTRGELNRRNLGRAFRRPVDPVAIGDQLIASEPDGIAGRPWRDRSGSAPASVFFALDPQVLLAIHLARRLIHPSRLFVPPSDLALSNSFVLVGTRVADRGEVPRIRLRLTGSACAVGRNSWARGRAVGLGAAVPV